MKADDEMLQRIAACVPFLAIAEQRVAKVVLKYPQACISIAIADLAELANVSSPTVIRFCKRSGYSGFADFKRKLEGGLKEGTPGIHRSVSVGDETATVVAKVVDFAITALVRYRREADHSAISHASVALAAAIEARRRVAFFGCGHSGIVALDARHRFGMLGAHAAAYCDAHFQIAQASGLGHGDCAVVVSNSGRSHEALDVCKAARAGGAFVICVTCSASPLAAAGDLHLAADHAERYDEYLPMASRLLHLCVLDAVATDVALRVGACKLEPQLRRAARSVGGRRAVYSAKRPI